MIFRLSDSRVLLIAALGALASFAGCASSGDASSVVAQGSGVNNSINSASALAPMAAPTAATYPFEGNWTGWYTSCASPFVLTSTYYKTPDQNPLPFQSVDKSNGAYKLSFAEGYTLTVKPIGDDKLSWQSGRSGRTRVFTRCPG